MADAFIDSFKKSGEAALDYGDIMDNVATSIAKSMIKSAIIQNVWDDEKSKQAAAMLASGDAGGAMQIVDEAMRAAQDLAPHIQELLKSLEPYLQMEEEKPENTLGSGIKGITEDTANLLASYLNAIRADVSYSKTLWERMDANTQNIAAALAGFSAPSLMEYQAQIAANTYNTSISTQNILMELQSVMGFGDEGRAIRILS
jgi:ABC-type glycerol-3-phosphate transport system substrate-binding protein